ncbi:MAG TPA: hypothetical protein VJM75_08685, partial [Acidimicrobiales bacterium]|nr:hypothetical protein [Acidimicrobiales bacterium]
PGDTIAFAGTTLLLGPGEAVRLSADGPTGDWSAAFLGASEGPPLDAIVYADSATGSDTNPGTQALPVQTLARAVQLVGASGWRRYGVIFLARAGGTAYTLPQDVHTTWPNGGGVGAFPLQILGEWIDSGQGTLTVDANANGSATPPVYATYDATGGTSGAWVADQWRGYFMRFLTGALATANRRQIVGKNDANTLSSSFGVSGVANGDTFVLERPGAVVQALGRQGWHAAPGVIMRGCEVQLLNGTGLATLALLDCTLMLEGCWVNGSANFTISPGPVGNLTTGQLPGFNTQTTAPALPYTHTDDAGAYFLGPGSLTTPSASRGACTVACRNAIWSGVTNTVLLGATYADVFGAHFGVASLRVSTGALASATSTRYETVTPSTALGAAVGADDGATLILSSVVIENTPATTAAGDAVRARERAYVHMTAVSGVGNAGVGLRTEQFTRAKTDTPNVGTTVTGAGGDVVVGANAVTTWALIAGGLAVNTTDLAAAIPQICRVSA